MLGIVYLVICFFFGIQLLRFLFPDPQRLFIGIAPKKSSLTLIPMVLFYYPAGFIVGLVLVTFLTYWLALLMAPFVPQEMPVLYPANVVALCFSIYLGSVFWQKCYSRKNPAAPEPVPQEAPERRRLGGRVKPEAAAQPPRIRPMSPGFSLTKGSAAFYILSILFFIGAGIALFYCSFHVSGGKIMSGYSVFSDMAPHTALISSFSNGMNFPTVYPFFPNDGIRYHFLFYFLCGNLNLLGMRIDHALNIPSILVMLCCFLLLGVLAVLLSGRRVTFFLAPVLVLFRSSYAVVSQVRLLAAAPGASFSSVIQSILSNDKFIGTTPKDSWGLWAVNVYANQRHLLLGVALLLILVFLFLPHVRRMFLHIRKANGFKSKIRHFLFCREAWLPRKKDPIRPFALCLLAIIIVICMPYFHGSALVAALIILCGMAVFSENRLMYAVVAAAAMGSSVLQALYFSGGASNVVSFAYYWGFLTENPSLMNVAMYIGKMMGIASVLLFVLLFTQKSAYRTVLLIVFGLPAAFAFFFTMTIDVTANHKFIQISLILFSVFLAALLAFLWKPFSNRAKKTLFDADEDSQAKPERIHPVRRVFIVIGTRILAVVLLVTLTATGISEWIVYYNVNRKSVTMNLSSPMVSWIEKNTGKKDVFLTAPFSMNTFFLSGRFAYYGHPYYAWSAGYDTDARKDIYAQLLTGCDGSIGNFRTLCAQENITYVLMDDDMRNDPDFTADEAFFTNNLTVAASFADENNTVIYNVN